ncbi:uncharacterized protein LOC101864696 [Aplysia californica]|uniref:Uncharacterized protein LOC101864696 n=1 Tax=Aplysia californica TaxID=6500 RepID=A0ABM0JUX0_APLCA|nr:uncharacterized protein LOC101864696 [Aplysia californica]
METADGLYLLATLLLWVAECDMYARYLERPVSPWIPREHGLRCSVWNQSGCAEGECCIKEVISFQDLDKDLQVGTKCQPLLAVGELCLRQSEGYLCDCAKGLRCDFRNNETYGHCAFDDGSQESPERKGTAVG